MSALDELAPIVLPLLPASEPGRCTAELYPKVRLYSENTLRSVLIVLERDGLVRSKMALGPSKRLQARFFWRAQPAKRHEIPPDRAGVAALHDRARAAPGLAGAALGAGARHRFHLRAAGDRQRRGVAEIGIMGATVILGPAAAAETVCHDEQLRIWAEEIVGMLSLGNYLRDLDYSEGIELHKDVARELKSIIESAFDHPEARTIKRLK